MRKIKLVAFDMARLTLAKEHAADIAVRAFADFKLALECTYKELLAAEQKHT